MIPDLETTWHVLFLDLNLGLLAAVLLMQPLIRDLTLGFRYTLSNFDDRKTESKLGRRLAMVYSNQFKVLASYAPLALISWLSAFTHPHLGAIATTFLAARLAYAAVSIAGIPILRSGAWTVGFSATLYFG